MKVTIKFNVGMTFALIGYAFLLSPLMPDESSPMIVESLLPNHEGLQFVIIILSAVSSVVVGMYICRALWNRLFPSLCGWKEITLAEAYAVSLFAAMFVIE